MQGNYSLNRGPMIPGKSNAKDDQEDITRIQPIVILRGLKENPSR